MNAVPFPFYRKLSSDAYWSLAGTLVGFLANLLAIKIITSLVRTNEYGQASLALGVIALLNNLFIGSLMTAQRRIYFDYLERGMGQWFARVFKGVLGAAGLIAFFLYLAVALVYRLQGKPVYLNLLFPVALILITQPYMDSLFLYLEAHRKQRLIAVLTVLQKALYPLCLWFLLASHFSQAKAIIISQAVGAIILLSLFRTPKEHAESSKYPASHQQELSCLRKSILGFGWALPLGNLAMWVQTTSDRYLLEYFSTIDTVGIYVINYSFWSIPYLLLNGWLEVFTRPLLYKKAAEGDWRGLKYVIVARTLFGVTLSILGTVLLYFVGESIASAILGTQYWTGRKLMMSIAIGHCFYVIGYSVLPVFLAGKKTQMILIAASIAAFINLASNFVAIPSYGILGAALSTLISYVIWAAVLVVGAHLFIEDRISEDAIAGGRLK